MAVIIQFKDYFRLSKPTDTELAQFKEFLNIPNNGKSLFIKMEATHAGFVNKNNRYYIPSRMNEGVSTFRTEEKPTKLLKHHNANSDPVGVIRGARFIPTIPEDLQDNPDVMTLMSSSAPIKKQLKAMRNLQRAGIINREGWRGLGYIELIAEVMDQTTIGQVQDGRYDAVSTNFQSPSAVHCSICGQNVLKDGWCDHDLGELYKEDGAADKDDFKFVAQLIPAEHEYLEASFITFEGDPLVSIDILDTKDKGKTEQLPMPDKWQEDKQLGNLSYQFKDSAKEGKMALPNKKVTLSETEQAAFDVIKKLRADVKEEDLLVLTQDVMKIINSKSFITDKEELELNDETAILYALEDVETKDQKINSDEICDGLQEEFAKMRDEGLLTEEEFTAADAKLSTQQRKKLSKSTFCGPERSFPVPDCAHVTAARRLIGRYKGPGNKATILACVSRKAKALGCTKAKDSNNVVEDSTLSTIPCTEDKLQHLEDGELRSLFHATELELIKRNQTVKRDCSDCAVHVEKAEKAEEQLSKTNKNLTEAEVTLSILRSELQKSYIDYATQVDESVKLGVEIYKLKAEKLALVGVLTQKYDNLDKAMEELKESDIDQVGISIMDSFDIEKAAKKLNDGLAKTPQGTVEDPTITIDGDNTSITDDLSAPAQAAFDNIKELIAKGEEEKAKQIYDIMKNMEMFPEQLKFEDLSADKNGTAEV